jgi:hypothetical protein
VTAEGWDVSWKVSSKIAESYSSPLIQNYANSSLMYVQSLRNLGFSESQALPAHTSISVKEPNACGRCSSGMFSGNRIFVNETCDSRHKLGFCEMRGITVLELNYSENSIRIDPQSEFAFINMPAYVQIDSKCRAHEGQVVQVKTNPGPKDSSMFVSVGKTSPLTASASSRGLWPKSQSYTMLHFQNESEKYNLTLQATAKGQVPSFASTVILGTSDPCAKDACSPYDVCLVSPDVFLHPQHHCSPATVPGLPRNLPGSKSLIKKHVEMGLVEIDECLEGLHNCDEHHFCVDSPGSFSCTPTPLWHQCQEGTARTQDECTSFSLVAALECETGIWAALGSTEDPAQCMHEVLKHETCRKRIFKWHEACQNDDVWVDSYDNGCGYYESVPSECDFADNYANGGFTATDKCCICKISSIEKPGQCECEFSPSSNPQPILYEDQCAWKSGSGVNTYRMHVPFALHSELDCMGPEFKTLSQHAQSPGDCMHQMLATSECTQSFFKFVSGSVSHENCMCAVSHSMGQCQYEASRNVSTWKVFWDSCYDGHASFFLSSLSENAVIRSKGVHLLSRNHAYRAMVLEGFSTDALVVYRVSDGAAVWADCQHVDDEIVANSTDFISTVVVQRETRESVLPREMNPVCQNLSECTDGYNWKCGELEITPITPIPDSTTSMEAYRGTLGIIYSITIAGNAWMDGSCVDANNDDVNDGMVQLQGGLSGGEENQRRQCLALCLASSLIITGCDLIGLQCYAHTSTNIVQANGAGGHWCWIGEISGDVWGSDSYTDNSTIRKAAVHAGVVQNGEKKTIYMEMLPGQQSYTGTTQNSVTSSSYSNSYMEHETYRFLPQGPPKACRTCVRRGIGACPEPTSSASILKLNSSVLLMVGGTDSKLLWRENPTSGTTKSLQNLPAHLLIMQSDGDLRLYSRNGSVLWSTNTSDGTDFLADLAAAQFVDPDTPDQKRCLACPAGKYKAKGGGSLCVNCVAGRYSAAGASSCSECITLGVSTSGEGSSTCVECAPGTYKAVQQASLENCAASVTCSGSCFCDRRVPSRQGVILLPYVAPTSKASSYTRECTWIISLLSDQCPFASPLKLTFEGAQVHENVQVFACDDATCDERTKLAAGLTSCVDDPDWADSENHTCTDYASNDWCRDGGHGPVYLKSNPRPSSPSHHTRWYGAEDYETFSDYAVDGVDASQACCVCGKVTVFAGVGEFQSQSGVLQVEANSSVSHLLGTWTAGYTCLLCQPGSFSTNISSDACTACPADTYQPILGANASSLCFACPAHSQSVEGSSNITHCLCNAGYTGTHGGPCSACVEGTYKSNNGSAFCTLCGAGTYSPIMGANSSSVCVACPAKSHSLEGSSNISKCLCNAGYTRHDGGPCSACVKGTYKSINGSASCTLCEVGKYSEDAGATSQDTCSNCEPGTYGAEEGNDAEADCLACPAHSQSVKGSSNITHCLCNAGYTGAHGGPCTACLEGTYKSNNGSAFCTSCGVDKTTTVTGANASSECKMFLFTCGGSCNCTNFTLARNGTLQDGEGQYGSNENCWWLIAAQNASDAVHVGFSSFDTDASGTCPDTYTKCTTANVNGKKGLELLKTTGAYCDADADCYGDDDSCRVDKHQNADCVKALLVKDRVEIYTCDSEESCALAILHDNPWCDAAHSAYTEYAFEIKATQVPNEPWGGFAEIQFYDCTGKQLVPSAWSNPGGNQGGFASHAPALAFDGNLATKWLDSTAGSKTLVATFSTAVRVHAYKWIAAEGSSYPGRNPASWKLKARSPQLGGSAYHALSETCLHCALDVFVYKPGQLITDGCLGCTCGDSSTMCGCAYCPAIRLENDLELLSSVSSRVWNVLATVVRYFIRSANNELAGPFSLSHDEKNYTRIPDITTTMTAYRGNFGIIYSLSITGSTIGSVWGSENYTDDSSIRTAAVHAGVVQNGETKTVYIEMLPGQQSYTGKTQNSVISNSHTNSYVEYGTYRFFTPNYCPAYSAYTDYAFETTQTNVASADIAGFAELRFYDCLGMQLVPSTWSNPDGNNIASYHYPSAAFDGDAGTNWLDRNKQPLIATFSTAVRVASYKWIAASDASMYPGRNPASWKLKARAVSSDAWRVLATVVLHSFTAVNNELVGPFSISADVAGESSFSGNFFMVPAGTWDQVRTACMAQGGDLASILSQEEAALASQSCPHEICYIGLKRYDQPVGGQSFFWTDGSPLSYTAWETATGQPGTGSETVVVWTDGAGGKWNDWGTGGDSFPGACKKRTVTELPTPTSSPPIIRIADLHGISPKCSIYKSSSGFLLLKFASDGSVNRNGFTAAWSIGGKGMMFI